MYHLHVRKDWLDKKYVGQKNEKKKKRKEKKNEKKTTHTHTHKTTTISSKVHVLILFESTYIIINMQSIYIRSTDFCDIHNICTVNQTFIEYKSLS